MFNDITWPDLANISASKDPGVLILFALVGLYTSVASVWPIEKRGPNKLDFIKFSAYIPPVIAFSLLFGQSPDRAFLIGMIPGPLIQFAIKYAKKQLKEMEETKEAKNESDKNL